MVERELPKLETGVRFPSPALSLVSPTVLPGTSGEVTRTVRLTRSSPAGVPEAGRQSRRAAHTARIMPSTPNGYATE